MTTEQTPKDPKQADPEQDPDKLSRLAELAISIVAELEELMEDSGNQFVNLAKRAQKNRQLIVVTIASLVLDVMLSVFLALAVIQIGDNTRNISTLTNGLSTSQTVQRQKALCPLYQLFLDSESDAGRKAASDPLKYDHAFVVIREGYDVLECDSFIKKTP